MYKTKNTQDEKTYINYTEIYRPKQSHTYM